MIRVVAVKEVKHFKVRAPQLPLSHRPRHFASFGHAAPADLDVRHLAAVSAAEYNIWRSADDAYNTAGKALRLAKDVPVLYLPSRRGCPDDHLCAWLGELQTAQPISSQHSRHPQKYNQPIPTLWMQVLRVVTRPPSTKLRLAFTRLNYHGDCWSGSRSCPTRHTGT